MRETIVYSFAGKPNGLRTSILIVDIDGEGKMFPRNMMGLAFNSINEIQNHMRVQLQFCYGFRNERILLH